MPKKSDEKVIQDEFAKRFSVYSHLFQSADQKITAMDEGSRRSWYLRAMELKENEVLKLEISEMKRTVYNELALRAKTDVEREGLRLCLIAIQEFEKRIDKLGSLFSHKPLQSLESKL